MSSARSSRSTTGTRSNRCTRGKPNPRRFVGMAGPTDMSELHLALDRLGPQLCHCGFKGECLGCKGIEMVRAQAEAAVAAASQPNLIQAAQEASMRETTTPVQGVS